MQMSKRTLLSTLIVLMCLLVLPGTKAQLLNYGEPTNEAKIIYDYIVIYRNWEQVISSSGGSMWSEDAWVTKIRGFENWESLLGWMNSSGYSFWDEDKQKRVRLNESQLVAIYDLSRAEKVELKLQVKEKTLPKRVEIQEEKWTDYEWEEIGKN